MAWRDRWMEGMPAIHFFSERFSREMKLNRSRIASCFSSAFIPLNLEKRKVKIEDDSRLKIRSKSFTP